MLEGWTPRASNLSCLEQRPSSSRFGRPPACFSRICAFETRTYSMTAVLPGRPNCRRQALATGYWKQQHFTVSLFPEGHQLRSCAYVTRAYHSGTGLRHGKRLYHSKRAAESCPDYLRKWRPSARIHRPGRDLGHHSRIHAKFCTTLPAPALCSCFQWVSQGMYIPPPLLRPSFAGLR
jgi:hypothetical protein